VPQSVGHPYIPCKKCLIEWLRAPEAASHSEGWHISDRSDASQYSNSDDKGGANGHAARRTKSGLTDIDPAFLAFMGASIRAARNSITLLSLSIRSAMDEKAVSAGEVRLIDFQNFQSFGPRNTQNTRKKIRIPYPWLLTCSPWVAAPPRFVDSWLNSIAAVYLIEAKPRWAGFQIMVNNLNALASPTAQGINSLMTFQTPPAPDASPLPPGFRPTILIVDDHKPVRDTLLHVLQGSGYRVIVADTGSAAIELAKGEVIAAALIDVHLHGMNGFECLRRLQEQQGPFRAWLITGAPSKEIQNAVAASGAIALLPKPFDLVSLLTTLKEGLAAPIPSPVVKEVSPE
jgi:CheY-like chemotaxis protein